MKLRTRVPLRVEELEGRLVPSTLVTSSNWSGYAVSAGVGSVTRVAGSWVVPAVSSSVSGYSSSWVGIDGVNNSLVEQIGTDSDYTNGQAHYYAWYEMYPAPPVNLGLTINPGDTISASVTFTGSNQFTLALTDVSTGGSYSTVQTSSRAQRSSAEWIQEAPLASFFSVLPLANFGTINFSGANATVGGTTGPADNAWPGSTLYQVNMANKNGTLKATTSPLTDSGSPATSAFSVTFVSSGSGGGGGGRRSPNVSGGSQTTPLVTVTVVALASGAQGMSPAPVTAAAPNIPATVTALTVATPPSSVAGSSLTQFGRDAAVSGGGGGAAVETDAAEKPTPSGPARPMRPLPPPDPDGRPAAPADQPPADAPAATPEKGKPPEAGPMEMVPLPPAPLKVPRDRLDGHEGQGLMLSALALTFALDRPWAILPLGRSGRRAGRRKRSAANGDGRRFRPAVANAPS